GALVLVAALLATASASGGKHVIGKLGQTLRDVGIHSRMSAGSRVYYHTKQYEYLVINQTRSADWTSVVLQNGSKGYIPTDAVAVLPYNVLQGAPQRDRSRDLASRGDATGTTYSPGDVAGLATEFIGTPYKWGGQDLNNGIDCSGFVKKMFGAIGVNLPRTAAEQVNYGEPVTRLEYLQRGDRLYFWSSSRGKIGHTGIYLGNGYFVHSSSGKGGVATSPLTKSWLKILVAARR
ncbi:MAG TPA: C40 family peptidase, partial [Fimbriimonadaceae bacterium]|nr:C40 family peptidase [Fimbriimonadaceae bacterium]